MQTNTKLFSMEILFSVVANLNLASFFEILVLFSLKILQNLLIDGHLQLYLGNIHQWKKYLKIWFGDHIVHSRIIEG